LEICTEQPLIGNSDSASLTLLTPTQEHIQTFYFAFVGVFGTPHLYRSIDRRANKKKGTKHPRNYWMNRYFPRDSFPVRMDMVHLGADRMDDLKKANFKLHVPVDIMEELRLQDSLLASFAKIACNDRCMTFEVKGPVLLNRLYFSTIGWINDQLKSNHLKGDTENIARLIYHFYGLENAPVPQPVPCPVGNKRVKIRFAGKSVNQRKTKPSVRLLQSRPV
jgi:hypothetical protein